MPVMEESLEYRFPTQIFVRSNKQAGHAGLKIRSHTETLKRWVRILGHVPPG